MTTKNNVEDFNYHKMQSLFRDFGVHNEDELQIKLDKESKTVPCSMCGKEIDSGDFIGIRPIRFIRNLKWNYTITTMKMMKDTKMFLL